MKGESRTGFDKYLAKRMKSKTFSAAFAKARDEIDAVDTLVRALDSARELSGLSKAELARRSGTRPEAIRRLLTSKAPNPTIATVVGLARTMGFKLALIPVASRRPRRRQSI